MKKILQYQSNALTPQWGGGTVPVITPSYDGVVFNRTYQYQSRFELRADVAAIENRTLDKWWMPTSQPRFDLKRRQYQYQFYVSKDAEIVNAAVPRTNNVPMFFQKTFMYQSLTEPVRTPDVTSGSVINCSLPLLGLGM